MNYKKLSLGVLMFFIVFNPVFADQILKTVNVTCSDNVTLTTTYDIRNQTSSVWTNETREFNEICGYGCTGNQCDSSPVITSVMFFISMFILMVLVFIVSKKFK